MPGGESAQLVLELDHRPALGRGDFLVSEGNAVAVRMVEAWESWPGHRLALIGDARLGKSHLAAVWRAETGARLIAARALTEAEAAELAARPLVIEDVHEIAVLEGAVRAGAEHALLHVINMMAEAGAPLLVTGRGAPAKWRILTPDLASRLGSFPLARLAPPAEGVLSALLVKFFADRQLEVSPQVLTFLSRRIERSVEVAERVVATLDEASLARKQPVTISMAVRVLGDGSG